MRVTSNSKCNLCEKYLDRCKCRSYDFREKIAALEETILFMRNEYSEFGGRGCSICEYQNGKFIKKCKLHKKIAALEAEVSQLKERVKVGNDCIDVELDKKKKLESQVEKLRGALTLIAQIAFDYDGYRSEKNLMSLIDELKEIARQALSEIEGK